MAEKKSGGGGSDIWWFIGILAIFFGLWILGGGPDRARQKGLDNIEWGKKQNSSSNTSTDTNDKTPVYEDGKIIY